MYNLDGLTGLKAMLRGVLFIIVIGLVTSDTTGYIEYSPGTLNLILSAPHGGNLVPDEIPDRVPGCYINDACVYQHDCGEPNAAKCKVLSVSDINTWELTVKLKAAIYKRFNKYPYVVINKLNRTKLDANRDKPEAALGVPLANKAWEEYHGYIDQAKAQIEASGPGLVLDLHRQSRVDWIMLGYNIRGSELESGTFNVSETSIKSLVLREGVRHFEQILRGNSSLGAFIEEAGFVAVPSPEHPHPAGQSFYRGGYITRRHGSLHGGSVDCVQIESPNIYLLDQLDTYSEALADATKLFMDTYYQHSSGWRPTAQWLLPITMLMSLFTILF